MLNTFTQRINIRLNDNCLTLFTEGKYKVKRQLLNTFQRVNIWLNDNCLTLFTEDKY